MGYRSDVGLVLKSNVLDKFEEAKSKLPEDVKILVENLINEALDNTESNRDWLLVWQDIKWYECNPEIEFFMNFIDSLKIEDYYFCRVGEDLSDTEVKGFYYENPFGLYISRHLDYSAVV